MKTLNVKGLALALGIVAGVWVLVVGLLGVSSGSGVGFAGIHSILFPGYGVTVLGSVIGGVEGFVEGYILGLLIAWIYNKFAMK